MGAWGDAGRRIGGSGMERGWKFFRVLVVVVMAMAVANIRSSAMEQAGFKWCGEPQSTRTQRPTGVRKE